MFQMLTSDFRGDFGPEKFSVKHLKKLVDRDLKTEGWSKYLRGVSEEDYDAAGRRQGRLFRLSERSGLHKVGRLRVVFAEIGRASLSSLIFPLL